MIDVASGSERSKIAIRLQQLQESIAIAELTLSSKLFMKPAADWLESVSKILGECKDVLQSKSNNKPFDTEDNNKLALWADSFDDAISDGIEIEKECITQEEPSELMTSTIRHCIPQHLEQVRIESWVLYRAVISLT